MAYVLYLLAWAVLVATVLGCGAALCKTLLSQPSTTGSIMLVAFDIAGYAVMGLAVSLSLFLIVVFVRLTCRFIRAVEDIAAKLEKLLQQNEQE